MGQTLTADTSGVSDADGLTRVSLSYQWLRNDGTDDTEIADAAGSSYTLTADDQGRTLKVKVSFTDDDGNGEELTSAATGIVAPPPPLSVQLENPAASHDGSTAFTFELRFSETPTDGFSYKTLRDHAFTVTGGQVLKARRLEPPGNIRWEVTVQPGSDTAVTIVLPATTDCTSQGAICTEDGRKLSNRLEFTVSGPSG